MLTNPLRHWILVYEFFLEIFYWENDKRVMLTSVLKALVENY